MKRDRSSKLLFWLGLSLLCVACGGDADDPSGASTASASSSGGAGATGGEGSGATGGSGGAMPACEAVPPHQISETPAAARATRVVWNGDGYGVIWSDNRDAPNGGDDTEMYFARLDATGNKIGLDVRVTNAPGITAVGSLVWNGSDYAVVFADSRTPEGIYFTRLDATGNKLFDEVFVAPGQVPRLTWSGAEYGFSWAESGLVQFVRLDPMGQMLDVPIFIAEGYNPSQARGTDGWGLAFHNPVDPLQIYFAGIDGIGALAVEPVLVSTGPGWHASLAARGDGFGVAWNSGFEMGTAVAGQIWFAALDKNGAVVGNQKPLSGPPGGVWFPSLAANPDGWGLGWVDDTKLSLSLIDGDGEMKPASLFSSTAVEGFLYMQVAANGSGYGLVWTDNTDGTDEVWFATACAQ